MLREYGPTRKGANRVTNGVSRDSARMTKSMEKPYIRGQF